MPKITAVPNVLQEAQLNQSVTERAEVVVALLRQLLADHGLHWHAPTVAHDESDNTVEISWWRANKSLIITIAPDNPVTYLKAWGPNIYTDMEEGQAPSAAQLVALWQWLYA